MKRPAAAFLFFIFSLVAMGTTNETALGSDSGARPFFADSEKRMPAKSVDENS